MASEEIIQEKPPADVNKFFSIFGKTVLVMILLIIIGGGAFYLGTLSKQQLSSIPSTTPKEKPENETSVKKDLTPTQEPKKIVSAGISGQRYTLDIPQSWAYTTQADESAGTSETRLTKGDYSLIIRQASRGVDACNYSDAPAPSNAEFGSPPAVSEYVQFAGASGETFRRNDITANPSAGVTFFGICQKQESENLYINYTKFGAITYEAPLENPNPQILKELDSIVATLKK